MQEVITAAGILDGPHNCPKGLRHGFGVQAVSRGIALNMVQKWLGHAQLTTTAIYANAVGEGKAKHRRSNVVTAMLRLLAFTLSL